MTESFDDEDEADDDERSSNDGWSDGLLI